MQMFHVSDIAVARLKAVRAIFVLQLDHDNVAFCKEVLESHNKELKLRSVKYSMILVET